MAKPKTKVEINLKPGVFIRIRCAEEHGKDPWLKRLYVLWADPKDVPSGSQNPTFHLAQTDERGYLSPTFTDLDPHPTEVVKLFADYEYYFYFVRHPGADLPQQVLNDLTGDRDAAKKKWGDWQKITTSRESRGKDKKGKAIKEAFIKIPEDPSSFIPPGSDLYKGWVLFRDMPGGAEARSSKRVDQCPKIREQVTRLQFHLGALRYPIGNQWHPYMPAPFEKLPGESEILYPNEGVFEVVTWNCVLRFQRDVVSGSVGVLDPAKSRTSTLSGGYDPVAAARNVQLMITESSSYMSEASTDYQDARADPSSDQDADFSDAQADVPFLTVVDKNTGDAIQLWLDKKNWRKPGKVLVAKDKVDSWMMEDVLPAVQAFSKALVEQYGFTQGLSFNNVLRDARMSVVHPEPGQIRRSIHKSGYAFDMEMNNFVDPAKSYPLYYSHDKTITNGVKWKVYALVQKSKIPTGAPSSYYSSQINRWIYDATSPNGGHEELLTADDAYKLHYPVPASGSAGLGAFLDFTQVAQDCGFERIGAHKTGWKEAPNTPPDVLTFSTHKEFVSLVGRLKSQLQWATASVIRVNGASYPITAFKDALAFFSLWIKAAAAHNPTPDVYVMPWTKSGYGFMRAVTRKPFSGRQALQSSDAPGVGATQIDLSSIDNFQNLLYGFTLRPVTQPVALKPGDSIELPAIAHPAHMEWWHFQYPGDGNGAGFAGKSWGDILSSVGWTQEGLVGKQGRDDKGIYGHWGLGYTSDDLSEPAK